jgi:hypothetical protein
LGASGAHPARLIIPLTLIVLAAGSAASQKIDAINLLVRIRQHVRDSIIDVPNYTCLETMDRGISAPDGALEFRERLRVEVLVAEHNELFAWPGSSDFSDPMGDWIDRGAIGNGNFWAELYNLFIASEASVKYAGMETLGGVSVYRFDFQVPSLSSRYTLSIAGKTSTTAYSGSFWADKNSLELVRIDTNAEDIPPDLDCSENRTSVTYRRVKLAGRERILPSTSELEIVDRTRSRSHNAVAFSGCRRYGAVSTLSFDDPPAVATKAVEPRKDLELPADVTLVLKLAGPITTEESAAGDEITAVLDKPLRTGNIQLARGAKVLGRIRRLEQHAKAHEAMTLVALEFYAVDSPEGRMRFKARLTGPVAQPGQILSTLHGPEFTSGTEGLDIVDEGASTGVGRFRVAGKRVRLDRGFRTVWKTE